MLKLPIRPSRQRRGAPCAAVTALAGLLLVGTPLGRPLVNWSYDSLYWFRADIPVRGVTILYMDEESYVRLHQSPGTSWDRALHARLLRRLTELGARKVAFDILFAGTNNPMADAQLVNAAKAHGHVYVAALKTPRVHQGTLLGTELLGPFQELAAVTTLGLVEVTENDGVVRQHSSNDASPEFPSLAACAADRVTDAPRAAWLNYYGPPGFLPSLSYHRVLAAEADAELQSMLSNQVVFVGAKSIVGMTTKSADAFRTPYTVWTGRTSPGVELNATAFLNLLRGDWWTRPPPWLEAGLLVLIGLGLGFGLAGSRPGSAVGRALAVATAIAVLTLMGAWSFNVWFPWMVVSGAQVPLALSWSLITLSAGLWRERRAFEQALALATKAPFVSGPSFNGDAAAAPIRPANLPRPLPPEPGVPVVPGYQLLRCIGQGAYGRVWLARDILGSFHAVKVLRRQSFKDPLPLEREFRGLSRFTPISRSHPGFVHILHVGWKEEEDFLYYAMELADDEQSGAKISIEEYSPRTLAGELARRGRCPLEEVVELGIQLADALEHLHRHQLIHRDIKPSNILFVKGAPKFADIGLVTEVTRAGGETNYLGTPGRIAPEGPGTPASDVYGLGMVLYETGLGMPVERFPELPPFMIQAGADPLIFEFNRVVMRACEFQERRRYPSAAALRDDLAGLRARMKAQSSPGSGPSRT